MEDVSQQFCGSEINVEISSWDGGFTVKLGDRRNGYVAETNVRSWDEVERWLTETAARCYPESDLAKAR
jgi:hypothetical protein